MSDPTADNAAVAYCATTDDDDERLDVVLARLRPDLSRARWRALIDEGQVTVNGNVKSPSFRVRCGMRLAASIPKARPTALVAQAIPLDILYEDADLLALNKPAGLVVHPAAGNPDGTLVNALLHHLPGLSIGGEERPGIVHRLDKDTSGVLVVAKTEAAMTGLGQSFRSRDVTKRYVAFCLGTPRQTSWTLVTGHARHPKDRKRFTTKLPVPDSVEPQPRVRRAETRFVRRAVRDGLCCLDVELITGRTHQIRAHLADHGFPLAMDALYGGVPAAPRVATGPVRAAVQALTRHALHAAFLQLPHPITGVRIAFEAPLPADLLRLQTALMEENA